MIITGIVFEIIISYMVKQGTESFGKCAAVFIIGLTVVAVFLGFLILNGSEQASILLDFYKGFKSTIISVYSFISFPIGEVIVFMTIFNSLKSDVSIYKVFVGGMLFSIVIILINTIGINLMLMGNDHHDMFFSYFYCCSKNKSRRDYTKSRNFDFNKISYREFC